MCKTCQLPDGSLNIEYLEHNGSCVFGCNHKVDKDYGMCPECRDHSHNQIECDECGVEYDDSYGKWRVVQVDDSWKWKGLDK